MNGYAINNDTSVYVSKSGNDSATDGTEGKPFLTIQAALDYAALLFGNNSVYIHVGDGVYEESLLLTGIRALSIISTSDDASKVIIKPPIGKVGMLLSSSTHVNLGAIGFTRQTGDTGALIFITSGRALINKCKMDGAGSSTGVQVTHSGSAYVRSCEIKNCLEAIHLQAGSLVCAAHNTGDGNGTVFVSNASIIVRTGTTPTGTTLENKFSAGQIFS